MRAILSKTPHHSSFSISRRFFHRNKKPDADEQIILNTTASSSHSQIPKKPLSISKLKSAITRFLPHPGPASTRPVIGTLFGHRRGGGRAHLAFQPAPRSDPYFLVELPTPTAALIREMASGSVRIALECETTSSSSSGGAKLLEEPRWRTYCNGRKCGYAHAREYYRGGGECEEWRIVKAALEPITIGAGVLPPAAAKGNGASGSEGELMYMRAKFERVSGSRDSEAFYMINIASEGNIGIGGPAELSIYLLRV